MNKLIPVIVIIILLSIGGYFFLSQKTKKPITPETGKTTETKKPKSDVFTSIKDAILKQMSLKCEYQDEKGNKITSYVKGKMIRVVGYSTEQQGQGQMLMRDDKMYIWDDQTKKGMVFTSNKETADQTTPAADKKEEAITNLEKYKDYCKVASIADSLFTVPSDVQFTDLAEQVKGAGIDLQKMMEQYKTSPPAQD